MHDCQYYEALCSQSIDDELTQQERVELEAHLAVCPACVHYAAQLRQVQQQLAAESITPPSSLHEDIMQKVMLEAQKTSKEKPAQKRIFPVFTMLAAAAAAVMLVVSGTMGDLFRFTGSVVTAQPDSVTMDADASAQNNPEALFGAAQNDKTRIQAAPSEGSDSQTTDEATAQDAQQPVTVQGDATDGDMPVASAPQTVDGEGAGAQGETRSFGSSRMITRPQDNGGMAVILPQTPDTLVDQAFTSCYVAVGAGKLPDFGGTLVGQVESNKTYYFSVKSSLSTVEKVLTALGNAGYELSQRDEVQSITMDAKADDALIVIIQTD